MPLHAYCPHSTCAAKIPYDVVKPTTCPQCRKTFSSAFVVATPAVAAPLVRASVQDDLDERPLGRAALPTARASTTVVKSRPGRPEPSRLMNAPASVTAPVFPDDGADDEDENLDPREVRRQARALAASIDTSTIRIADQDEGTFKFADMWAEGASAREKAAQAKTAPKRKARR